MVRRHWINENSNALRECLVRLLTDVALKQPLKSSCMFQILDACSRILVLLPDSQISSKASLLNKAFQSHSVRHHGSEGVSLGLPGFATQHENLLYTEKSIFFGGPLISPAVEISKRVNSPRLNARPFEQTSSDCHAVLPYQACQESRPLCGSTTRSQSPVFVPRSMQTKTSNHPHQ